MVKNSNLYIFDITDIYNYYNGDRNVDILWVKLILCSIFTIWARCVGPQFRSDQMSD